MTRLQYYGILFLGLLGLYNRSKLTQLLEMELARHQRYKRDLSVVLVDVDYFKKTNDTLGSGHKE